MKTEIRTFKDAFKFPLKFYHGMVFTADNNRAIDFAKKWHYPNGFFITESSAREVIKLINGEDGRMQTDLKLKLEDGVIYTYVNGEPQEFIIIRGWGHLTGTGGLNLRDDLAMQIQDDFAAHILKVLSPSLDAHAL